MDGAQVDVAADALTHQGALRLLPDAFRIGSFWQGAPLLEDDEELGVAQGAPASAVADEGPLTAG